MPDLLQLTQAQADALVDAVVTLQGPIPEGTPDVKDAQGNIITPAVPKDTPVQFARKRLRLHMRNWIMTARRQAAANAASDAAAAQAEIDLVGF